VEQGSPFSARKPVLYVRVREFLDVPGIDIAALANEYRLANSVAIATSQVIDEYKAKLITARPSMLDQ
jgi:hypothetical protein